jgi:hypothetical protein
VVSSSALAAFKSCLSQNGVKVTGTTASAVLAELRNSTGKAAAAVRTCRVLLQPTAPPPARAPNPGPLRGRPACAIMGTAMAEIAKHGPDRACRPEE